MNDDVYVVLRLDGESPEVVEVFTKSNHAHRYAHEYDGDYTVSKHQIQRTYTPPDDVTIPETVYIIPSATWKPDSGQPGSKKYHLFPDCFQLRRGGDDPNVKERDFDQMHRSRKTPCKRCFPDELRDRIADLDDEDVIE